MDPATRFADERSAVIRNYATDSRFGEQSRVWREMAMARRYVYNFEWLGRPVIQFPQDIQAMQELVWTTRPDLIIETGIAHGGSLVLSASLLALLDLCDAIEEGRTMDPRASTRKVVGIDIDIRRHNRVALDQHPMRSRIQLIEGSSIDVGVVDQVKYAAKGYRRVMVALDSSHAHAHVRAELDAYATLVTPGCYCVVFDTFVEDLPSGFFAGRPWDVGDNPKTAVREFLKANDDFEIDTSIAAKLMVTVAPDGFLRKREAIETKEVGNP